jgi:hypothetical protein
MTIIHNSRDINYRSPFGALQTGSSVHISIDTEDIAPENVTLLVWKGESSRAEHIIMKKSANADGTSGDRYTAEIRHLMRDASCGMSSHLNCQTMMTCAG